MFGTQTLVMSSFDASPDAYVLREEIGRSETSGSSVVWLASASEHDADVAIKIQDLEKTTSTDLSRTQQDIQRMKELKHPNLAQLHAAFVARGELWLVLQLHAGSCQDIMRSRFPTGLEEQCVTCILREVLQGLGYLHRHGIIHRQLRASSILVDSHGAVRLSDFGLSGDLVEGGKRRANRQTFVSDGIGWMAPEALEQSQGYDSSADVWSLGITAIELACGKAPFAGLQPLKVMLEVLQGGPPGLPAGQGSKSLREFLAGCLQRDPRQRPVVPKLLQAKLFDKLKDGAAERHLAPIIAQLPPFAERRRPQGGGGEGQDRASATANETQPASGATVESAQVAAASIPRVQSIGAWDFDDDDDELASPTLGAEIGAAAVAAVGAPSAVASPAPATHVALADADAASIASVAPAAPQPTDTDTTSVASSVAPAAPTPLAGATADEGDAKGGREQKNVRIGRFVVRGGASAKLAEGTGVSVRAAQQDLENLRKAAAEGVEKVGLLSGRADEATPAVCSEQLNALECLKQQLQDQNEQLIEAGQVLRAVLNARACG